MKYTKKTEVIGRHAKDYTCSEWDLIDRGEHLKAVGISDILPEECLAVKKWGNETYPLGLNCKFTIMVECEVINGG